MVNNVAYNRECMEEAHGLFEYEDFLKTKVVTAPVSGFDVSPGEVNPALKDHQRDAVIWACRGGRRALFESFGLGKTVQEIEFCRLVLTREGGKAVIVLPLGVRQEFYHDAVEILGMEKPRYITKTEQADSDGIYLTNYERVRDGDVDPKHFQCAVLDEAAVLRSFGSKTYQTFLPLFRGIKYKLVATATPSPNKLKELIHYAGFLEVMDTGQALTRFFQRDSTKANNLTLYPHKEEEFWLWCSTWALYVGKPSDLGYEDSGYELPGIEVRTHILKDEYGAIADRDGQFKLLNDVAKNLSEAAREKKESLETRAQKVKHLLADFCGGYVDGSERISSEVPGSPSGRVECETAGTGEGLLPDAQRGKPGQIEEMEERQSGEDERVAKEEYGKKPGEKKTEVKRVVCGEQVESKNAIESCETTAQIRDFTGNQGCDDRRAEVSLCDMRGGVHERECDDETSYRSQPRNKGSSGGTVRTVQHGAGVIPRFTASADKSCRVSGGQVILWADLNVEQRRMELICEELGLSYVSIYGSDKDEAKLKKFEEWKNKDATVFISKRDMYGCGVNLQQAHKMIFAGIDYKFHSFIQAIHRIYRFLQVETAVIDIICTEAEQPILDALMEKWKLHEEMQERMGTIVREYGLNQRDAIERMKRSIGVKRVEIKGKRFTAVNNDCVEELQIMGSNSVDLIHTSIPFSNHYEYTPSYNDFGHNEDTENFFRQMDFLSPELLRVLKPGRVFACHVKDRVLFGNATGMGMPTMEPFHALCIQHYMKHGFAYFGMITVVTDVVRENNQTYRLGWTEQCKDGTKMGVGCPEYILLFRKLPSDTSKAYADDPVKKTKEEYTRAQWQIDAHGFWRSSGDRLLTKDEMRRVPVSNLQAVYRKFSRESVYDYEQHVQLAKELDEDDHLPATFMVVAPGSWSPDVWDDINRMRTLNTSQSQRREALHVCLARGSLILTREGYKPIENVKVGDLVLTHKGNWKPVIGKACTGVKDTIQTKAVGVPNLITTPDHKMWARMSKYVRKKDGMRIAEPEWVEAKDLPNGGYVNLKLPNVEISELTVQEWWLVGRYLADGHIGTRGDFFISVGKEKQAEFEKIAGDMAGAYAERDALQYRLKNLREPMKETLRKCGHGAENKQVPVDGLCVSPTFAATLLDGYLSGDGSKTGNCTSVTSTSRALLLGMAMVAQRARGVIPSIFAGRPEREGEIQGRSVHCKQEWVMNWREPAHYCQSEILEDGAWKKVKKPFPKGKQEVWSIQVADDASYTAEGCIVKNCPLQLDIVDRIINRYSNPGDLVLDPFGGLGTVALQAMRAGRRGYTIELNDAYFRDAVGYLKAEEEKMETPSLFDLVGMR